MHFMTFARGFGLPLLLAAATVAVGSRPVQADSTLTVGGNPGTMDYSTPGTAVISGTGTTASGNFAFENADAGTTTYESVTTYNSSSLNFLSGGHIYNLETHGTSNVTSTGDFFDSTVADGYGGVAGFDNSTADINGGTCYSLNAFDNSTINFSGGHMYGGSALGFAWQLGTFSDTSRLDLFGYNLTLSEPSDPLGFQTVNGTLLDGSSLDNIVGNFYPGTLYFNGVTAVAGGPASNPVPEASTVASFGLLLALGLSGLRAAKKRHTTA